ncbi:MAG: DUF3137 domain-containing protein [Alphaproteobacteria bacterium]
MQVFTKIGSFIDKIYYRVFPSCDTEKKLGLTPYDAQNDNASDDPEIKDLRDMDDESFLKRVKPDLDILESLREIKFKTYKLRKKLAVPVCAVLLPITGYIDYLLLWLQRGSDDGAAGLTVLIAGGIYWWVTQPKREYARAYKETILPKLAKVFGNFTFKIDGKIPMESLKPSQIMPSHDSYNSEDYFQGVYKGVEIEFSEIHLTEQQGSGKNRRTVTKFKGLAVLLKMQRKKFLGHTTLERNSSSIGEWFRQKSFSLKKARMADPEFEKLFDVYTNDQVEARYLVDPLMIENLKALYDEYSGKGMIAAWYESQMLVLVSSDHNHFEPASIKIPATDPQSVLNMKREIGQILSIIDRLDLFDPRAVEDEKQAIPA